MILHWICALLQADMNELAALSAWVTVISGSVMQHE